MGYSQQDLAELAAQAEKAAQAPPIGGKPKFTLKFKVGGSTPAPATSPPARGGGSARGGSGRGGGRGRGGGKAKRRLSGDDDTDDDDDEYEDYAAPRAKKTTSRVRSDGRRDAILQEITEDFARNPAYGAFAAPVTKKIVPDYANFVRRKMDLGSIVKNCRKSGGYASAELWMADVRQVEINARWGGAR
jgi:hypothetical protein